MICSTTQNAFYCSHSSRFNVRSISRINICRVFVPCHKRVGWICDLLIVPVDLGMMGTGSWLQRCFVWKHFLILHCNLRTPTKFTSNLEGLFPVSRRWSLLYRGSGFKCQGSRDLLLKTFCDTFLENPSISSAISAVGYDLQTSLVSK